MNALQLYKFVENNGLEVHNEPTDNSEDNVLLWIPFYLVSDFVNLVGADYFIDVEVSFVCRPDSFCIEISQICEDFGFSALDILDKE